jgi:aminoglycoside phosphotransferase (APT) family kinase protein
VVTPSEATLEWVLEACGGDEVVAVRPLVGGWTSSMHAIDVEGGAPLVLRRMFREPWVRHAVELLEREAWVLGVLADTDVPAARMVAVDARAERTDAPALLMTRLPGALVLDDLEATLEPLARTLVAIHRVDARPRDFQSWAVGKGVPEWGDARVWERAIAVVNAPPPAFAGCFLHRDYHPGNVLFAGGAVSGVVDWVETSWGPPDLDVAHCCTNLALLYGLDAPERFREAYVEAGGTLSDTRYWALLDAVGFLPDPVKVLGPWRDAGRDDLGDDGRARLEAYVESNVRA